MQKREPRDLKKVLDAGRKLIEARNDPGIGDLIREACRIDLFFMLRWVIGLTFIEHEWWLDRCDEVERDPDGHLDLWARDHGKSTIITFGKTIQDILINPEVTIGIFSHTRPAAKAFLKQVKREFESNARLRDAFSDILFDDPKKESPSWSEDGGIIVKRKGNPKEATLEAWGLVDGMPTGKHFQIRVYDDVVTDKNVTTEEMRDNTVAALELSYSLGTADGILRMIGTRYHYADAYSTILKRGTATPRIRPCINFAGEPYLLTTEQLEKKRSDMGAATFAAQMMLDPLSDNMIGFKRSDLRTYHDSRKVIGNVYIIVDPANAKKKSSDYTSAWVLCLCDDNNYYALEMIRDRLNLTQRCQLVFDLHKQHDPLDVIYEEYGMQADIAALEMKMDAENYHFDITAVGNRGAMGKVGKTDRIKWLLPYFEQHRIWLPLRHMRSTADRIEPVDIVEVFREEEFCVWPFSGHEDMLDALCRIHDPAAGLKFPRLIDASKMAARREPPPLAIGTGAIKGWY